jgi:hypothetical protein
LLLLLGFYKLLCKKKFRLVGTPPHFFPRPIQTIALKMVKIGFSFFLFLYPAVQIALSRRRISRPWLYIHTLCCVLLLVSAYIFNLFTPRSFSRLVSMTQRKKSDWTHHHHRKSKKKKGKHRSFKYIRFCLS